MAYRISGGPQLFDCIADIAQLMLDLLNNFSTDDRIIITVLGALGQNVLIPSYCVDTVISAQLYSGMCMCTTIANNFLTAAAHL